jgi:hypothetical protein
MFLAIVLCARENMYQMQMARLLAFHCTSIGRTGALAETRPTSVGDSGMATNVHFVRKKWSDLDAAF